MSWQRCRKFYLNFCPSCDIIFWMVVGTVLQFVFSAPIFFFFNPMFCLIVCTVLKNFVCLQHLMPPYGTPPHPYVAMYPPGGLYAHPSIPPVFSFGACFSFSYNIVIVYLLSAFRYLKCSMFYFLTGILSFQSFCYAFSKWHCWDLCELIKLLYHLVCCWVDIFFFIWICRITCKFSCREPLREAWKLMVNHLRVRKNCPSKDQKEVWAVWICLQARIMNLVKHQEHLLMECILKGALANI